MPQFSYAEAIARNGQIAEGGPRRIDSYLNALVAQESDIDFATTGPDGTYTVRITGEEGVFEGSFVASGNTVSQIIDGLIADFGDELLNVATLTNNDPALEFRAIHPDRVYTIEFPSNPSTEMSLSVVQAAGGTRIPLGTVVIQGANDDEAQVPGAGTTSANALGILVNNTDSEVNSGDPTVEDGFPPGSTLSVMRGGAIWVNTEDAVSANGNVFFRIQNAAAGTTEGIGKVRSDVDGGDAVQLLGAKFKTSTTAAGLAKVLIQNPATA